MSYLLCFTKTEKDKDTIYVSREYYDNFEDAIERYTLLCTTRESVTLSNLDKEEIIRQLVRVDRYDMSAIQIY
ncbi:MAG: hypothetical protein SPD90_06115 [Intestinibacter sp.]|uniref:hypothetical protein n=1 Tax=Intestinibacter sp. TaxID=1965304 RepID=UPI002A83F129|nr:hypothetical protein [Intestinibacter sp.]MDY4574614.1 hypothetical protein [Intestinibacter sp.]